MKKELLFVLCIIFSTLLFAQRCDSLNTGTKTLYPGIVKEQSPLLPGYVPVFINHVGRHGARHLTKEVTASTGYQLLLKADSLGMLTKSGIQLKGILQQLNKEESKNIKSISQQGIKEQEGLADRMFNQNREIFSNGTFSLKTQTTKEVRTKQTADAFLKELKRISGVPVSNSHQVNDTVLRFYDLAPAYIKFESEGARQKDLQIIKEHQFTGNFFENIAQRFFKKEFLQSVKAASIEAFVTDIYGFFTILPSVQTEMDRAGIRLTADSIKQFFTCPELLSIGKLDQAEDYLLKGPGTNKNGIQVKIAAPLLVDFINSTDAFIKQQEPGVQLRFSHAETIAPFAALLGLNGADSALKSSKLFTDKIWDAAKVVPLSANIQWILYKSKATDEYLIKFLLNEKEVQITGLKTGSFPYYNWKTVRSFYINKLQKLHLHLTDNLYTYLQNVQ